MSIVESTFVPHKLQLEVMQDQHRFKVVSCGRRFGKTRMAVNYLIYHALKNPGNYWMIAPTYTQVKLICWDMLKKDLPVGSVEKTNESELWVKFITGGSIRLLGADNEEALRGAGLKGAVLDEFSDMKPHVFQSIIRPMLLESKGWCIFTGTPKGFNSFFEMFIRDKDQNKKYPEYRDVEGRHVESNKLYKSWQFKSIDSPYIDPEEVEDARRDSSPEYFRQEYEASFENYTGLVFKEFTDNHIKEFVFRRKWNVYLGIDTGKFTAVTFIGLDYDNKAWVFDEVYDIDGLVEDIVKKVKEKLIKYGLYLSDVQTIIDSASQVKREYMAQGILTIDSEKDTLNSIDIIRARLKNNKLVFHKDCLHTISQVRKYQWEEKLTGKSKLPKPKQVDDHAVSCLMYTLNSQFVVQAKARVKRHSIKDLQGDKLNIFDKEMEKMEDELGIEWRGNKPYYGDSSKEVNTDQVTGY